MKKEILLRKKITLFATSVLQAVSNVCTDAQIAAIIILSTRNRGLRPRSAVVDVLIVVLHDKTFFVHSAKTQCDIALNGCVQHEHN